MQRMCFCITFVLLPHNQKLIFRINAMTKKLFKMMLTLALFVAGVGEANATKTFAAYGTPASNGTWNAETNTYSWTASYSNLMTIFEFPNGELADYTSIHLTTSSYTDAYRICFMNGSTAVATIAFYSAGQKDLNFAERTETKDLDLSKITHISFGGASGSGSIVLSKAYIEKPFKLNIDDTGKAVIDVTDLKASGCLTLDEQTGVLTSTLGEKGAATWGRLAVNFPSEGVDLSDITGFSVQQTGTVLFNNFEIGGKGFWSSVMGRSDLATFINDAAVGDPTKVTVWRWNVNSAGTQTITSVTLNFSVMTATDPHFTALTAAQFNDSYCEYNIGKAMGQGSTIYGNGSVAADKYADLNGYDELRINGTPGQDVRLLFNWGSTKNEVIQTLDGDGNTTINLKALPAQQLNAFKFQWDGKTAIINSMELYKASVSSPYNYIISGSGVMTASVTAALADAAATGIDATGITKASALVTANPNCMIVANEGKVTNVSNVIQNGICSSLVLTDGKPFEAPVDFTASAASYTTTINAAAGAGTLCLPFAASIPAGVKAYTLTYTGGDEVTATPVAGTIPANTPVLLNGSGALSFTGSGAVDADAVNVSGALTGIFQSAYVPKDCYVLQKKDEQVGFYKVDDNSKITATPFRAYLTVSAGARHLNIKFDDETTGIQRVESYDSMTGKTFDLQGRCVVKAKPGVYVRNGQKIIVR